VASPSIGARPADGELRAGGVDSRRRLALAGALAIVLLSAAAGGTIWRYEVALGHSDVALRARADALRAQQATSFVWRERETMNEYLLDPAPHLLAEVAAHQVSFDRSTRDLATGTSERALVVLSRRANAGLISTFRRNRDFAGRGASAEARAVARLNANEDDVVRPLDALQRIYAQEVRRRRTAISRTDSEALISALLGGLIGLAATVGLAVYARSLLLGVARRRLNDWQAAALETEFTAMLQSAEAEEEADELLKHHLERSVTSSSVVVFRRNNSDDRLEARTPPGGELGELLAAVAPRSCLAIRFGRPHEENARKDSLIRCAICAAGDGYSNCHPLLVGGQVIGSALVTHAEPLRDSERSAIVAAVRQAGPVLANLRNLALARFRAATDALTGLANSREVQDTLKRMCAHASRTLSPLTALLLDLDHFKQINDTYGHASGDDVLAAFASTVQATLRASDFVGRYGGEEFVVLLPDTGPVEAEIVAEKIRVAVEQITLAGVGRPITVSIGLATLPDHATDSATLLQTADRALYTAKSNGRNRVEATA
jgi:diguanylate cyclase (GGDEF)-like protein